MRFLRMYIYMHTFMRKRLRIVNSTQNTGKCLQHFRLKDRKKLHGIFLVGITNIFDIGNKNPMTILHILQVK